VEKSAGKTESRTMMSNYVCTTCGTQFAETQQPPCECKICTDERQYVGWDGQQWTTLDGLRQTHGGVVRLEEIGLYGIGMEPSFAIGQRALLFTHPEGNVLWDCVALIDDGLVEMVKSSTMDEAAAEERILEWLGERCSPRSVPLAGNSVHQDRAFLRRYMPRLHDFLHYRNVDVSTVKELVRRWSPDLLGRAPSKTGQHRALDDLHESIRELQFYRSHAFALQGEYREK